MDKMITNETLSMALISCMINKVISPEIIINELQIDGINGELVIQELIKRNIIFGYNGNKKVNLFISMQEFEKEFSGIDQNTMQEQKKDFCVYDSNTNIFTCEINADFPLDKELKQKALDLIKNKKQINASTLQKNLKTSYANAGKLLDWLLEQNFIKKSNFYEVIEN